MEQKTEQILTVNNILVEYYGIPPRAEPLPEPIDLLIATILSQNTNDRNSFKAYQNLRNHFPSWEQILNAEQTEVENLIKVAGLGRQKSKAIKNLIQALWEKKGRVSLGNIATLPNRQILSDLTALKGIGVKTASCVLLFALDRDVCPVDTHVHRTVNRIGIVKSSQRDKTFELLNQGFPDGIAHQFHTNLIRLGREICKPKNPACGVCPVKSECSFEQKNINNIANGKPGGFMLLDNV